ncbi:MAG: type II toxin-antitoxin system HicA family toxin [Rhodoferax sp.]|uniref:type II toxin-antitoxin system HicA family toxin n=1 Tax=Rhodoferax sp. TaxID=50421 RepID=UPI00178D73EC|nr:type II toxin-antitoxin system HicA family toxin [Rhodoferax sp.]NMM13762.1 type II toxin-antitoxin system HicA family toxin [Rhodoferax sp.]
MNGFYKQVAEILRLHGYKIIRQNGTSHQIWSNGVRNQTVSTNCESRHTANGIMKQAGIDHKF